MPVKSDSEFKQFYWDLASDDKEVRIKAVSGVVLHLQARTAAERDEYVNYSIDRLVKGLASNRESARQGFVVTLCEQQTLFPVPVPHILELIDQHLMMTSSLSGAEERDAMFGKLFGYLAIIRSGSLAKQTDAVCLNILDRIIFLHNKRTWVQELTIEALLSLLAALPRAALLEPAMNKISSLLKSEEGLNANQIMLNIALQQFAAVSKDFKKVFDAAVPAEERISINSLEEHAQALIQSAKKFPQVHKVWDYIMSYIAPLSSERELPSQRLQSLSDESQTAMAVILSFLSTHLWSGTKEKRALAMKLTVKLFRLVPTDNIPDVLTAQTIRSITACRNKSVNTLYELSGSILEELAASADGDDSRLALLAVLSQHSVANFDKYCHTSIVSNLLSALDDASARQYLKLLVGILIDEQHASPSAQDGEDEDEEEQEQEQVSHARSLIVSLVQLAKTRTYQSSASIIPATVMAVLLRLTRFSNGHTEAGKVKKSKKAKKGDKEEVVDADVAFILECVKIVEDSSLCTSISGDDLSFATLHLQAGLADVLLSKGSRDDAGKVRKQECLHKLWTVLAMMFRSNVEMRHPIVSEDEEDTPDVTAAIATVDANIATLITLLAKYSKDAEQKKTVRLVEAGFSLIMQSVMQFIVSGDIAINVVLESSAVLVAVLEDIESTKSVEEDEEPLELKLFELSVDMLSSVSESGGRAMRETIKRFWLAYVPLLNDDQVSGPLIDAVLGAVIDAEDVVEALDEQVLEEEEAEEEEEKAPKKKTKKVKAVQAPAAAEDDEEDIMIKEEDMMDFLMQEDEDMPIDQRAMDEDSEEGEGLMHTEEADDALVRMIQSRKETRKEGLLAAKNKHILLRTRIMDILEVFISKVELGTVLFCMFRPMLLALRKAIKSKIMDQLTVGPPFIHRFETLLVNELLKKKIQVRWTEENAEEMQTEFLEELQDLTSTVSSLLVDKDLPKLRSVAQEMVVATTRLVSNCQCAPAQEHFLEFAEALLQLFVTNRRSEINSTWMQNLFTVRFPAFFLPRLWPLMVQGLSTKVVYARGVLCEMIAEVMKKGKKLDPILAVPVNKSIVELVQGLAALLLQLSADESSEKEKDKGQALLKHIKPVLAAIKETLDYIVQNSAALNGAKKLATALTALSAPLEKVKEVVVSHTQQKSSSAIKAIDDCSTLLVKAKAGLGSKGGETSVAPAEETKTKKDKKRKAEKAEVPAEPVVEASSVVSDEEEKAQKKKQKKDKKK